ncbi:MAG: AAA family ATPase [Candidatus Cloacimonadota bacterium]|nr:AAA family ATPase [Candidatus Cloacimonadota bacterium]
MIVTKYIEKKDIELIEGENRDIVVLFAEIKELTNIFSINNSGILQTEVNKLIPKVKEIIEQSNGILYKFHNNQITAFFGANTTSEKDLNNAIESSFDIINKVAELNNKIKETSINVSIGIDKGLLRSTNVNNEISYLKGLVIERAKNLQQNAPLNQILITKKIAESLSQEYYLQEYGSISIDKNDNHSEVLLVSNVQNYNNQSAMYQNRCFVDRKVELNQINTQYDKIKDVISSKGKNHFTINKPTLINVEGEAGIGKTHLVYKFLGNKIKKGVVLLNKHPKTNPLPFSYIISILTKYAGIYAEDSASVVENKLNKKYQDLALFIKNSEERKEFLKSTSSIIMICGIKQLPVKVESDKSLYHHININFRLFFEALAEKANEYGEPLILFLDDFHLMDSASAEAFEYIIQTLDIVRRRVRRPGKHYLIICTTRSEHQVSNILRGETNYHEVNMGKFSPFQSKKIIEKVTSKVRLSRLEKDKILKHSEGNPFYIKEWVKYYNDETKDENIDVPSSISTLIQSRIDKLGKTEKSILQTASVIGEIFYFNILFELLKSKVSTKTNLYNYMRFLEKYGFVNRNYNSKFITYKFSNELIKKVAYNNLLEENRITIHSLVGNLIEEKYSENIEEFYYDLVEHFEIGNNKIKLKKYLIRSANFAKNRYANEFAISFYKKLERFALYNKSEMVKILIEESHLYQLIGNWDKSEEKITESLFLVEQGNNQRQHAFVLVKLISQLLIKGNLKKAKLLIEKALVICNNINTKIIQKRDFHDLDTKEEEYKLKEIYSELYLNIGKMKIFSGVPHLAKNYFQKSLNESKIINDKIGMARSYMNLGMIHNNEIQSNIAFDFYKKALDIFKDIHFMQGIVQSYLKIGILNQKIDKGEKALSFYKKSLSLSEEIGFKKNIANSLMAIGTLSEDKRDSINAIEFYKRALNIFSEMNYKTGIAHAVENIGSAYKKQNNLKMANNFYQKLNVIETIDSASSISLTYERLGDIYTKQRKYSRATKYYQKSINLIYDFEKKFEHASSLIDYNQNIDNVIDYYNKFQIELNLLEDELIFAREIRDIGETYFEKKNFKLASKHLNTSLNIFFEVNEKQEIVHTLGKIAQIKYFMGDFAEAKIIIGRILKIAHRNNFAKYKKLGLSLELDILLDEKNFEKAKKIVDDIINISIDLSEKNDVKKYLIKKAEILLQLNQLSASLRVSKAVFEVSTKNKAEYKELSELLNLYLLLLNKQKIDKEYLKNYVETETIENIDVAIYLVKIYNLINEKIKEQLYIEKVKEILENNKTFLSPQRKEIILREFDEE